MGSFVDRLRTDLEARGEFVAMANARKTGWFAVAANTWSKRCETARRNGREGPNLVIYRTESDDPRDHHVIPYSVARNLLVEDTLTHKKDGSYRWELTLKDGKLKVTHRPGKVDVSKYRGARLLVEETEIPISEEVVANEAFREGAVRRILDSDESPTPKETQEVPVDLPEPPPRFKAEVLRFIRDTKAARELKGIYGFKCQVCDFRMELTRDSFYIEVHHVRPLGGGHAGLDIHDNMLVLCPNHHAMFDYGIPCFLSPQSIEIAGTKHELILEHALSPESIAYHNFKIHKKVRRDRAGGGIGL